MKYLPLIALIAATSASAAGAGIQNVGQSQKPAQDVSACIAKTWADKSQQQVVTQNVLANGLAADVYVPGQQPPNGAAAVVRPAFSGNAKTWVGFRAGSGSTDGAAAGDINSCL
ncbi:hypothetical protein BTRA_4270 [Burkholderia thailandensis USAMRU Malaysia |uniref:Uncharacterized protein n=2 Tax=Burkholderia thailandensis TaxID=57975 RepID=A0AAW9CNR8_BURTH|nr:hypothetical protein [Burkholderia thailandensis]AHI67731.1 hypothetical protein BTL_4174 [Burkholderia thailandensis H0587]AHI76245.1 hypothetical protein BTQ_4691 [Burkholderia thailandensis 2002721723]AIC90541.1 hypothetical protein BTRA_4270 [Burkholderia thailandensis USAMRU Malaysia \